MLAISSRNGGLFSVATSPSEKFSFPGLSENETYGLNPITQSLTIARALVRGDLEGGRSYGKFTGNLMAGEHFEPFGESIEAEANAVVADGSPTLRYTGISIFWTLVFAIVTARVLYYNPDFAQSLASVRAVFGSFRLFS